MPNGGAATLAPGGRPRAGPTSEQQTGLTGRLQSEQLAARLEQARAAKAGAAPAEGPAGVTKSISQTTTTEYSKKALKFCWLNLIWSYGLTFIYIDLHFFLKYAQIPYIKDFFCEFGEEWVPPGQTLKGASALTPFFGILEIFAVIFINVVIIFLLALVLVQIYIILNPCALVKSIIPGLPGAIIKQGCELQGKLFSQAIEFILSLF